MLRLLFPGSWINRQFCAHNRSIVVIATPSKAPCQNDRASSKPPEMRFACAWNAGQEDPGAGKTPVGHSKSPSKTPFGKPCDLISSKSSLLFVRSFTVSKAISSWRRSLVSLPLESILGTTTLFKAGTVIAVIFKPWCSMFVTSSLRQLD